jgi:hypothetical protein
VRKIAEITLNNIMKEIKGNISRTEAGGVLDLVFTELQSGSIQG